MAPPGDYTCRFGDDIPFSETYHPIFIHAINVMVCWWKPEAGISGFVDLS